MRDASHESTLEREGIPAEDVDAAAGEGAEEEADDAAAEPAKPEAEAKVAAKPAPEPAPKATAWAALRRREQQLVQKQQEWSKSHEAELAAVKEFQQLKARAKDDPFAALKALGHEDGRAFLERIAETGGKMTPEQIRIADLESQLQTDRAAREEAQTKYQEQVQQQQLQQNLDSWHKDIHNYITTDPEFASSIVNVEGTAPAVFEVMQKHYQETGGERMEYRDAVKAVESQMEAKVSGMLNELVGNKRGLAMFHELASKLNKPASASKKAPSGINSRISNHTGAAKQKAPRFEDALDNAASWLDSQFS